VLRAGRFAYPVKPKLIAPLRTLGDVRRFMREIVPPEHLDCRTWRLVAAEIDEAARTGDVLSATVAVVLGMNNALDRPRGKPK
jgi:hypothetical protein